MFKLQALRDAKKLEDVARLVGFTPKGLSFVLYKLPDSKKYNSFEIAKRGGGKRQIKAPEPSLSLLQRRLATLLTECLEELKKAAPPRRSLAHGFEKGRSIITNAQLHKRRRYVFNVDLADFFPSINFGRVRGFFINDKNFSLQPPVATVLAQIACFENQLPQGSPCSPVISNLIGHVLDGRLARFAKTHKCTYSRYVDDITFSTSRKHFPPEIGTPIAGTAAWQASNELRSRIENAGFKINDKKTRMQYHASRQVATGLVVNEKVNVRQEYFRAARNMCDALFKTGSYFRMVPATLTGGAVGDPPVKNVITSHNQLGGMLAHIYQVKNSTDLRADDVKKAKPTATRSLYFRFLFYKNFVANKTPVIVPEGKTDTVYLRAAIRYSSAYHPRLGELKSGKLETKIRFMNFSKIVHDVMQLGHGTSEQKFLIADYERNLRGYRHAPLAHPVIVLFDNDDGAKSLFGYAKNKRHSKIGLDSTDPFYYLGYNLYLVKTPEFGGGKKSCIEDLFPSGLLKTIIDGKVFDPNKEHEEAGKYGKVVFAKQVVTPNASTIDFSGFAPLLDRIVAVLDHHATLKKAPPAPLAAALVATS
ncbi:retron Ec67 family RNA-directed DNA polymerase/endonuclease [Methylobacterium sp. E-065]|uniref:retron Ec67 family RNA-directed DNA polymerase/endonuclease n=1 Tax=Methylobacterium sp. E-065 TaxID=2836583 RepID=UPI001FBC07CC|nr:retron Ec67 family RNA-directed DNA polymerase/endonuclease [Methylobacterium sp. E-065]MCJ2022058.1 retron Ec67 family RNA-directed DNA polymerase/endonuclease [Methylobacterium sp. E-065]